MKHILPTKESLKFGLHVQRAVTATMGHHIALILMTLFDLVMIAPILLQCIFSYTILANPEVEPHALHT